MMIIIALILLAVAAGLLLFTIGPLCILYALIVLSPAFLGKLVPKMKPITNFVYAPVLNIAWNGTAWYILMALTGMDSSTLFVGVIVSILLGVVITTYRAGLAVKNAILPGQGQKQQ